MSEITVDIKIKPYLKDYLINQFGEEPIRFSGISKLNSLVKELLVKTPDNYKIIKPAKDIVRVKLPFYNDKNVKVYNYLTDNSQNIIEKRIYNIFYLQFYNHVNMCAISSSAIMENGNKKMTITESIILFIEKYEISPDNISFDTLKKNYYRFRNSFQKVNYKNI